MWWQLQCMSLITTILNVSRCLHPPWYPRPQCGISRALKASSYEPMKNTDLADLENIKGLFVDHFRKKTEGTTCSGDKFTFQVLIARWLWDSFGVKLRYSGQIYESINWPWRIPWRQFCRTFPFVPGLCPAVLYKPNCGHHQTNSSFVIEQGSLTKLWL